MSEKLELIEDEPETGYTVLDLNDKAPTDDNFEIEHLEEEPAVEKPAPAPAPAAQEDDDEGEGEGEGDGPRKRQTRSQRLKAARDAAIAKEAAANAKIAELEAKLATRDGQALDAAAISMDLLITTLDDKIKALRVDYDAAFDSGDRNKLWDVQTRIAELTAEKKEAEREKRSLPMKAPPKSGGGQPQQTPTTTGASPQQSGGRGQPDPRAVAWAQENDDWFQKNRKMTRRAFQIDREMREDDGFDSAVDEDYYEELTARLKKEFPNEMGAAEEVKQKPRTQANNPTIQGRGAPMAGGKVKVTITAADRAMARELDMDIMEYAKQKARREAALGSVSQYTEIE